MSQPTTPAHARAKRIIDEVRGVKSMYGVNEEAWLFLRNLVERTQHFLSPKQEQWLDGIERRVFRDGVPGTESAAE